MVHRTQPSFQWKWSLLPAAVFTCLLVLDLYLVSPFIGWYDGGEMVGATACLGISHPSGQAFFHLLGKCFLLLPFNTPAWRLGAMSAFCSAASSLLFWGLAHRLAGAVLSREGVPVPPSRTLRAGLLLLTLAWSLSLPWWKYSLTPLVYATHLLLALSVLWALSLKNRSKWFLAVFILGVATVFRPTQFFALPLVGLAFLMEWRRDRGIELKDLLVLIAMFGLGRSTLLYLPLRSALRPSIAYGDLTHPLPLLRHVFALKFSKFMGGVPGGTTLQVLGRMGGRFWTELTPIGILLILIGTLFIYSVRKKVPVFVWVALAWGAMEAFLVLNVPFPTLESHQILLGWVFSGFLGVIGLVFVERAVRDKPLGRSLLLLVLVSWSLIQGMSVSHLLERKAERGAQDYARNLLMLMEPDALYYPAEENEYFPVVGYQQSFDFRKGIEVIEPGSDPTAIAGRIREGLSRHRPLYVTRKWALPPGWRYVGLGPLFQVTTTPEGDEGIRAKGAKPRVAWQGAGLENVALSQDRVTAGWPIEIHYTWMRTGKSDADASRSLVALFVDANGKYLMKDGVIWLQDIHDLPSDWFTRMKPGRVYVERRILFIPSDFPPGDYRLVVGLQKVPPVKAEGKEAFELEFYERSAAQDLQKFQGKGENGALIQFAPTTGSPDGGFWPVTKSGSPLSDPYFAPVATLKITD